MGLRRVGLALGVLMSSPAWAVEVCGQSYEPTEVSITCNGHGEGSVDLDPLRQFPDLVAVSIVHAQIEDLSVLTDLPLEFLQLHNTTVAGGLAPIATMTSLTDLRLVDVGEHAFTEVAGLTQLTRLRLQGSSLLTSVDMLRGHTQLTDLTLIEVPVTDLTPIAGATQLERLYCASVPVHTVPDLAEMSALSSVAITNSELRSLDFLAGAPALQELDLSSSRSLDLGPLSQVSTLRDLDVSFATVTGISAVHRLENLTTLNLFMTEGLASSELSALHSARPDLRIVGSVSAPR